MVASWLVAIVPGGEVIGYHFVHYLLELFADGNYFKVNGKPCFTRNLKI